MPIAKDEYPPYSKVDRTPVPLLKTKRMRMHASGFSHLLWRKVSSLHRVTPAILEEPKS
ncbi:BZ3500_MvSof-1268-A1-R1_Chr2-1g04250 [Microbotryum saponariae]|uniref:BZ3500_MvSof-1268-A1-R1_Chr2-1g04250 protein n=1 Tax=Microbotryum saponariae TaxID=289078 RepID=A0A2X0M951_9BASI|nr:BZ3500_MvSof-1268-A1-R1_Chr2-1g04250 [Microbotryum saponariae]SCZ91237.1 BZ3501_MvSof-1269-A2-R1_Chr2-1g03906 [Microbotryum saponariae]